MESSRMSGVVHCFVKNILCRDCSIIQPCVPHLTLSSVKGVHVPAAFIELKLMAGLKVSDYLVTYATGFLVVRLKIPV